MGLANALNTMMNTAYQLLVDTALYIMAIAVLAGAISALFTEYGIVELLNRLLSPLMRPLFGMPGAAALGIITTYLSDNPAILTLAEDLEYRRYFKQHNRGWYLGANMGMMGFKMSKPQFSDGWFLENRYSKGYGMMIGICGGFEYQFADRWLLDAYFGWSYMLSWYNGYSLDGTIDLYPHRPVQLEKPDPFNGSHEWLPNKIGVSIGFMIFNPARRGRTGSSCAVR